MPGQGVEGAGASRSRPGRVAMRVLLALFVVLAGGEILVRGFITGPSPQVYDPEIGYSYQPDSDLFQAKEGFTHLHLNSLGLNDREIAPRDGRCRVLVIGDSYTAALQVRPDLNFTSVAERIDAKLDVVNAGRDGLFLGDMSKVAARLIPSTRPDLILYVISERAVDTDIRLPGFDVVVEPNSGKIVDATMRVEGQEALKRVFGPVLHHSALATRLSAQFKPLIIDAMAQFELWRKDINWVGAAQAKPVASAARGPSDEQVLAFLFRRFRNQAPAALLYVNGIKYGPHSQATIAETSRAAQAVARRAADSAGVQMFGTGEYLIESLAHTGQPPFGFQNALLPGGHLNPAGHEAVGHALVDLVHAMGPELPDGCQTR